MMGREEWTRRSASSNAIDDCVCLAVRAMCRGFASVLFCLVLLFWTSVSAEEVVEEVVEEVLPVEGEAPLRDPFWPVGYTPSEQRPDTGSDEDDEVLARAVAWPALIVRGRTRASDGTYRVLIDGVGVARLGDVVSRQQDGMWFHRRLTHLDGDGMRLVRLGVTREKKPGADWLRERETGPETIEETEP